jgi:heme exporter protein D
MPAAVWMTFAVAVMVGLFAGCVAVVVALIRLLENVREKQRRKGAG